MSVCPVCETKCPESAQYCNICGFTDEHGIARPIATKEEARHRLEFIVKPHRNEWERLKIEKAIKEVEAREAKAKDAEEAAAARESAARAAEEAAAARESAAKAAEAAATREAAESAAANEANTKAAESAKNQKPETTNNAPDSDVNPGDIIRFGRYDWRVLEVSNMPGRGMGKRALILKETMLAERRFNDKSTFGGLFNTASWDECSLRRYLNEDFYNSFSNKDQSRILETHVVTSDNPHRSFLRTFNPGAGKGGKDTIDKIFLLSIDEIMKHLELSKRTQGEEMDLDDVDDLDNLDYWWLRTTGTTRGAVTFVYKHDTQISVTGMPADHGIGVRPAMWIRL
ncbi:MAG: DUF6273 domain-containing protein [Defluviitaleaceae bacterium]|nr:DUF6273 domain-containing protein [Defluviitaleaceae bacterium]